MTGPLLPCGREVSVLDLAADHLQSCGACAAAAASEDGAERGVAAQVRADAERAAPRIWAGVRARAALHRGPVPLARLRAWLRPRALVPAGALASVAVFLLLAAADRTARSLVATEAALSGASPREILCAEAWIEASAASELAAEAPRVALAAELRDALLAARLAEGLDQARAPLSAGVRAALSRTAPGRAAACRLLRSLGVGPASAADGGLRMLSRSVAQVRFHESRGARARALDAGRALASAPGPWLSRLHLRAGDPAGALEAAGRPAATAYEAEAAGAIEDQARRGLALLEDAGAARRGRGRLLLLDYEAARGSLSPAVASEASALADVAAEAGRAAGRAPLPARVAPRWRADPPGGWQRGPGGGFRQVGRRSATTYLALAEALDLSGTEVEATMRVLDRLSPRYSGFGLGVRISDGRGYLLRAADARLELARRVVWRGERALVFFRLGSDEPEGFTAIGAPAPVADGAWYRLRLRVSGAGTEARLYGKIWRAGAAEPGAWTVEGFDAGTHGDPPGRGTVGLWAFQCTAEVRDLTIRGERAPM